MAVPEEKTILDTLMAMVAVGDEEAARDYLVKHFASFPPELQARVALATFAEGVGAEVTDREIIARIQEQGLRAADAIERTAKTNAE